MREITPITREEKLWNGEDLEPLTREEMYIKRIFDKTQAIPDKPLTRKEILMEKAGEGGGGDVTIKQLSVTANGTYSKEGTAYSPVVVNVPTPENAYLLKEASGSLVSFNDGTDLPMPSFICNIDAVQDLHGYDSPWAGGAGKNKLENSAVSSTSSGVTYTVNSDTTISCLGTASATSYLTIAQNFSLKAGTYILNGCPIGGGIETMRMSLTIPGVNVAFDTGSGAEFTLDSDVNDLSLGIRIGSGQDVSGKVFKPMIRLATETDPTYAPYSNICPISGHTGLDAVISPTTETSAGTTYSASWQTEAGEVYGGEIDLVSGVLTVTDGYIASYDGEILPSTWISDSDVYAEGTTPTTGAEVVYKLAEAQTYQLTPTQIKSLLGTNNAWCDTGDVDIDYFAKEVE
jgi:hypothetical protein